jgi:hypothetical protein
VKDIIALLQNIEDLLYPSNKKTDQLFPIISRKVQLSTFSKPAFRL